jgi:hypothetical protein
MCRDRSSRDRCRNRQIANHGPIQHTQKQHRHHPQPQLVEPQPEHRQQTDFG